MSEASWDKAWATKDPAKYWADEHYALKAENERLRADAERFIWLADRIARYAAFVSVNPSDDDASDKNWFHIEQGEDLRAAIDDALIATKEG